MNRFKYKKGDKVVICKIGALDWESADWAKVAYGRLGLDYPDGVATIDDVRSYSYGTVLEIADFGINSQHFVPHKTVIHTPTQEIYNKVVDILINEMGMEWASGDKNINEHLWVFYEENTCVNVSDSDGLKFSQIDYYKEHNYTTLNPQDFLTEEEMKECLYTAPSSQTAMEKTLATMNYHDRDIIRDIESICRDDRWIKLYPIRIKETLKTTNKKNIMSTIKNTFKSKENKALEYFELGTVDDLNREGLNEFLVYLYETDKEARKGFLEKIVEAYKEDKK